jgi:hypothetical protein
MSTLIEVQKAAEKNEALKNDLLAARKQLDDGKIDRDKAIEQFIAAVKKYNFNVKKEDFEQKDLSEDQLTSVAGGGSDICLILGFGGSGVSVGGKACVWAGACGGNAHLF